MPFDSWQQQMKAIFRLLSEVESACGSPRGSVRPPQQPIAKLREALRVLQASLEEGRRPIKDREEELRRRAEEVAEAARRKDEFLTMLSHELRNPLAAIANAAQVLDRISTQQSSRPSHLRDLIIRQTQHLARLADDLLDLSQLGRGELRLRKEPVELQAVVARSAETLRPLVDEKGHRLKLSLPEQPVWLEADPARLEQVLVNLLSNAVKYTPPGGQIALTVLPHDGRAEVRVRDSGLGIHPELLPFIFDLFTHPERSRGHAQEGVGLGLSLVRRLVELHGGTCEAASDGPGRGSEFVVCFPLLAAERVAEVRLLPVRLRPLGGTHVLIVEDCKDVASSLAMLLRLQGCEVRVAYDGETALDVADGDPPDVVLLDIGLPGIDGYQVAERLRARPGGDKLRLVALTGFGQDEDRRRSQEVGFDRHLVKPVDPEELQALLQELVPHDLADEEVGGLVWNERAKG